MTTSIFSDAFEHHLWANEQVLAACAELTPDQLQSTVPGLYGSIIDTLRHLIQADSFYLWVFSGQTTDLIPAENALGVADLRAANDGHKGGYRQLLAGTLDPDAAVVEQGDGWDYSATTGIRLAQVVHHGSDHRSQVCTALTNLGIEPPDIDLWAYGRLVGRSGETEPATT
jgi:uncharacterized damage-inducible protein DinB